MMRKILTSSAYSRRIQTSRREIAIAVSLTLAAIVLTIAAIWTGSRQDVVETADPTAVERTN